MGIEGAARVVIETGEDQVAGHHGLPVAVLGQGVALEPVEGTARGREVRSDHPLVAADEGDQRDALVGRGLEVPGGAVDAARGLGSDELAAVAGRAPGEKGREILGSDVAGEAEAFGAAALPGSGADGTAGDVVVAARVLAPEVGGGPGEAKRFAGADHDARSPARVSSAAVSSAAASAACSRARSVASAPRASIIRARSM